MSKFKELYDYCQTLEPKVSTKLLERKILELSGVEKVKTIIDGLNVNEIRGYFLSASNTNSAFVKQNGCDVIVIARDLNECWKRFVRAKELMHLLDSKANKTSDSEQFRGLLTDFEQPAPMEQRSEHYQSEVNCLWMAIACLCPEKARQEFLADFHKGRIDHYSIAVRLKIPQLHVKVLLRDDFMENIDKVLAQ